MKCSDPALTVFADYGYCLVRHPAADIAPLQLLREAPELGKGRLRQLGHLTDVFKAGSVAEPTPGPDVLSTDLTGVSTGRLRLEFALNLLRFTVAAFGGAETGLDAGYRQAHRMAFQFQDVWRSSITEIQVDEFLHAAVADPRSPLAAATSGWRTIRYNKRGQKSKYCDRRV